MRDLASLLFGREAGELLDLIAGEGGITGEGVGDPSKGNTGESTDREAVERVLRSGEWCGSIPGRRPAGRPRRVF